MTKGLKDLEKEELEENNLNEEAILNISTVLNHFKSDFPNKNNILLLKTEVTER